MHVCRCIFFFISDAFSNTWKLADWSTSYPPQWLQSQGDANNCGVFVCTMAEMELKGYRLSKETIGLSQAQYLREYHATVLVKDVVLEDYETTRKTKGVHDRWLACVMFSKSWQRVGLGIISHVSYSQAIVSQCCEDPVVQCDMSLLHTWLHTDCAGVNENKELLNVNNK